MRLIDADALKERILKERDKIPLTVPAAPYELVPEKANLQGNAMRGGIRVALRCMEQTPTIDAEPVRHGRWIEKPTTVKYCSHSECSVCGSWQGERWMNYCPNCGAKMDAKDNNVPTNEPNKICPINGAPCNECVPGAYCAKMDGGDTNGI